MQYALTILTYLFDMFILTTFLMNTLHHFKKRYAPLYLCVLVGCECCLYGCEVLNSHFPTIQSEITAYQSGYNVYPLLIFHKQSESKAICGTAVPDPCITWRSHLYFPVYKTKS